VETMIKFIIIIIYLCVHGTSDASDIKDDQSQSAIPKIILSTLTDTISRPVFSKNRSIKIEKVIIPVPLTKIIKEEIPTPDFELSGILINNNMHAAIIHDKKKQEYVIKKENTEQDGWIIYSINNNSIYIKNGNVTHILKLSEKP